MPRCTRTRVPAVQTWPDAPHTAAAAVAAAGSMSQSSKKTWALLPPSSRATFFSVAAPAAWMRRPVSTDPVNPMALTWGWATRPAPITSPVPWMTLKTPGGMPASWAS